MLELIDVLFVVNGCSFLEQSLLNVLFGAEWCNYIPGSHTQKPGSSIQKEVMERGVQNFQL